MAQTLGDLIDILLDAARSAGVSVTTGQLAAGTSQYTQGMVQRAINGILNDFVRESRATRQIDTVPLVYQSTAVDFSGIVGFDPERLIESGISVMDTDPNVIGQASTTLLTDGSGSIASLTVSNAGFYPIGTSIAVTFEGGSPGSGASATGVLNGNDLEITLGSPGTFYSSAPGVVVNGLSLRDFYQPCDVVGGMEVTDIEGILQAKAECGRTPGTPRLITFDSMTNGFPVGGTIYPAAKATGKLRVVHSPQLVWYGGNFPTGNAVLPSLTHNLRADMAEKAVRTGGVCWLQQGQIENVPMTNPLKADYVAHVNASRGRGNLGVKSIQRLPSSAFRGSGRGWW